MVSSPPDSPAMSDDLQEEPRSICLEVSIKQSEHNIEISLKSRVTNKALYDGETRNYADNYLDSDHHIDSSEGIQQHYIMKVLWQRYW